MSYFKKLNDINVNDHTEKKGNLTYLSWAFAWGELKKQYPMSYYTIYENTVGWNYFTDNNTCWVKTGVTVVGDDFEIEHIEYLPIMDYKNKSIKADSATSFDVNKAIQRSLTKAVARHGLGLYIYAGEDLPNAEDDKAREEFKGGDKINKTQAQALTSTVEKAEIDMEAFCKHLGVKTLADLTTGEFVKASNMADKRLQKIEKERAEKPKEVDVAKMGEPNAYDELKQASELNNVKL